MTIPQNANVNALTDNEIEAIKIRVHTLSQELWSCTPAPLHWVDDNVYRF
ncbi:hypothetical protein [Allocoleopsis franciscana]|uniref:Uncharacterized protein n=1 Tax=Allocoleopsis franciscana PCC 7113 TaxID=1173027 RepID=K9WR96_9CYAN|nr:hypothetical protein [Allocoleopsis franciscana]AFZ22316.1 hypothetical protein Mic7113_6755 [Allocoleopsis franciscana PCC 7113]